MGVDVDLLTDFFLPLFSAFGCVFVGTRIGQASECFVYWKDPMTNDTWGLNFTSPIDAKQFRECCVSRLDFRSHFRLFSFFLSLNLPCPTQNLPSFPTSIHPLLPSISFRSLLCVLTCFLLISSFLHGKSKIIINCCPPTLTRVSSTRRTVHKITPSSLLLPTPPCVCVIDHDKSTKYVFPYVSTLFSNSLLCIVHDQTFFFSCFLTFVHSWKSHASSKKTPQLMTFN